MDRRIDTSHCEMAIHVEWPSVEDATSGVVSLTSISPDINLTTASNVQFGVWETEIADFVVRVRTPESHIHCHAAIDPPATMHFHCSLMR
jgi:hypothetical protein